MDDSLDDIGEKVVYEGFKKEYEPDEHWKLRKAFLEHVNKTVIDFDDLLCCAQLFINIEFLGCRYAPEVMKRIETMAAEVPEIRKYRQLKKNKCKRTFVTAKEAVQARYTGSQPKFTRETYVPPEKSLNIDINYRRSQEDESDWTVKEKYLWEIYTRNCEPPQVTSIRLTEDQQIKNLRALLRDVIVFEGSEENDLNYCLNKTTACMRKNGKLDLKFDDKNIIYHYSYNDQIIAEGSGDSKKEAKKAADQNLIEVLKANCYTIRSKVKFYSGEDVITKTGNKDVKQESNQIQEDNLGFKLLAKLGWKGGSLGANGTGIIDPINLEIKIGKTGLGSEIQQFDKKYFRSLLQNFRQNQVEYDLIFSSEFSKEERAEIHKIASQLNLRTKSYGKNTSRHLVISTRLSPQVLRQKLIEGDENLKEKYELVAPPFVKKFKPRLLN